MPSQSLALAGALVRHVSRSPLRPPPSVTRRRRQARAIPTSRNAGNGGYDVCHYVLALNYRRGPNFLAGEAMIRARATQSL